MSFARRVVIDTGILVIWDDGIIDPARTRVMLAQALRSCASAPSRGTRFGVFRM